MSSLRRAKKTHGCVRRAKKRISSQGWAGREVQYPHWQKAHGRTTHRQATAQPAPDWIGFPHAAQTVLLTRDRRDRRTKEFIREQVYLITSLPPEEACGVELANYIRGHWGIETNSIGSGTKHSERTYPKSEQGTRRT